MVGDHVHRPGNRAMRFCRRCGHETMHRRAGTRGGPRGEGSTAAYVLATLLSPIISPWRCEGCRIQEARRWSGLD